MSVFQPGFQPGFQGVGVSNSTGSGVGAGLSWAAESQIIWASELRRRQSINMPTVAELEAKIAAAIRRKRSDEWLLGLTDDAQYAQEAV